MIERYRIKISGTVQGVGFRPTVYRYATKLGLFGYVQNTPEGVVIEAEGEPKSIEELIEKLKNSPPPLAKIEKIVTQKIEPKGQKRFTIASTEESSEKSSAVSPDITVCDACIAEMKDASDRRYGYPFINCTDCGPRYTITKTVPYDRKNTSMSFFMMCKECEKEYNDPLSRRYHAEPISCPNCGPTLTLWIDKSPVKGDSNKLIEKCVEFLREGKIIALKGLGGFHIMCDAKNDKALKRLRERKSRPHKPFAVMVRDIKSAEEIARVEPLEKELLLSKERPIVLLRKKESAQSALSDLVAPGIDRVGIMLPYTPLHLLLLEMFDAPLVATSANLADEPIIRDLDELNAKLIGVFDAVLDHDREIVNACDDSVAQVAANRVQWLRVARGVAPLTIPLSKDSEGAVLATGANQKSTIAISLKDRVVLSPHIGDLGSIESMEYFTRTVETFERFYDFRPQSVVCDLHPGYETTKWAKSEASKKGITLETVQHHYAHALAVMAEYDFTEKVLAFAWDGTGYGEDGTVWGAEVLLCDVNGYERVASLRPFRLLGGERAVKEPRRSALALLFECFSLEEILSFDIPTVKAFTKEEIKTLYAAYERGINSPLTSSMGRVFDAVASLAGVCQKVSYEGQSGLLLEKESKELEPTFTLPLVKSKIDFAPMLKEIVSGRAKDIAGSFIASLADLVKNISREYPELPVVLTGGVFQNQTLLDATVKELNRDKRVLFLQKRVPPNDASIALGQLWYALHRL